MKNLIPLLIFFVLMTGCKKASDPTSPNAEKNATGGMSLAFNKSEIPANVATVVSTLSRQGYSSIIKKLNVLSDSSAEITLAEVPAGVWTLKIDATDVNNILLYTGQAEVAVVAGQTVNMSLVLQQVPLLQTGTVKIVVTWGGTANKTGWIDYEKNPVLQKGTNSWESIGVSQPSIYKIGDKYFMYYGGLSKVGSVALATSVDGNEWIKYGSNPIISIGNEGSWDAGSVSTGPIILIDSTYIMYYQGYSQSTGQFNVGIALSKDGYSWTKPSNNRIKVNGNYIYHASYVIQKDGTYFLYYDGYDNSTGYRAIFLASSVDGISWEKVQEQPILKHTQQWENGGITFSTILFENGKYISIYADDGYTTCNFGAASSVDGIMWVKDSLPIFSYQKTFNKWANAGVIYPFLTKVGNQKRIYYVGAVGAIYERKIGYAYFK